MRKPPQTCQPPSDEHTVLAVKQWVNTFVVAMNLCPFAQHELANNRVRFARSKATTPEQLLASLRDELELLNHNLAVETTLLIHAHVLQDFSEYNQFLSDVDNLLVETGLEGVYQVASFHPDYQFGGTTIDDAENYTNRSPYPLLHLIREASLERAIAAYPDADQIPARNIALMNKSGRQKLQTLFEALFVQ